MIFENTSELKERIESLTGRRVSGPVQIFTETSSYMSIHGGTVLRIAGTDYFVRGDTKEGRFGIEDQPKLWVKYAVDLGTGAPKIIKLVFHEQFVTSVGPITVRCTRSPLKEAQCLELVRGDPRFMQGHSVTDQAGNLVRIIDFVRGKSLFNHVASLDMPHERYYHEVLPGLIPRLVEAIDAIAWLHSRGQHHGDIRNDHLLVDPVTGRLVWIDFDYAVNFLDYDVWSMGNVITYVVAKGIVTFRAVQRSPGQFPLLRAPLDEHDASAFYAYRIANLAKVYPYVPREVNDILMRFSAGAIDFYTDLASQARDLREAFGLEERPAKSEIASSR